MPIPYSFDLHAISGWARIAIARKLAGMFRSAESIVNLGWAWRLTLMRRLSRLLGATVFPPRCCLCAFEGTPPDLDLCAVCRADLPWDHAREPGFICALRFELPADQLIRELKYQRNTPHARVLGELLASAARERGEPMPQWLVPVPLHRSRFRERGFNQSLLIARHAGRALGVPYFAGAVRRVRDTPSQTGLGRSERRANLRDAFALAGGAGGRRLRRSRHVALVDDVVTTGSTLHELRELLLAAGVERVDRWAVARALP
jgi:ComF family protein